MCEKWEYYVRVYMGLNRWGYIFVSVVYEVISGKVKYG